MERENLLHGCQGKASSGEPVRANTDAVRRGGVIRSSDEAAVMGVERRGGIIQ